MEYKRIACASKKIYKSFQSCSDSIHETQEKLSRYLRHPVITQFLRLESYLLVVEQLEISVDDLKCPSDISHPLELSILTDTCSEPIYLHGGMEFPIVHRDLTAGNVLLDSLKINSIMVNVRPDQLAKYLSLLPETHNDNCKCGPSLSTTVLVLFLCSHTQVNSLFVWKKN